MNTIDKVSQSSKLRGKVGKGRKFDHIQRVAVGKDSFGNTIYRHIYHWTRDMDQR